MHAFLYKNNMSKLFSDDADYEAALKDGWTDAPLKVTEEKKADEPAKPDQVKSVLPHQSEKVEQALKFKKINLGP